MAIALNQRAKVKYREIADAPIKHWTCFEISDGNKTLVLEFASMRNESVTRNGKYLAIQLRASHEANNKHNFK